MSEPPYPFDNAARSGGLCGHIDPQYGICEHRHGHDGEHDHMFPATFDNDGLFVP
jgi:hypothetical protein